MCSIKSMIKMALGTGLLLIVGYVALPQYRAAIAAVAPYLFFLACPLAMYFMMGNMNAPPQDKKKKPDQDDK